ncbi:MAG: hypothetical protein ACI8S7_000835 [Candidatus Krumholzibacteriia bacterium]|jgi:hypothetical protein
MGSRMADKSPGLSLAAQPALLAYLVKAIRSLNDMITSSSGVFLVKNFGYFANSSDFASSLAQLSFKVAVRFQTMASGVESLLSMQKYPWRINWQL